ERRDAVPEIGRRGVARERPVVAEDLDGAARDERRAAEQRDAQLLRRAERAGDRIRNAQRRPPAPELLENLERPPLRRVLAPRRPRAREWVDTRERAALRRVLAAERVARADASALERREDARRDVVHVAEGPDALGPDEPRQPAREMVAQQPSDEIAFGRRARP